MAQIPNLNIECSEHFNITQPINHGTKDQILELECSEQFTKISRNLSIIALKTKLYI